MLKIAAVHILGGLIAYWGEKCIFSIPAINPISGFYILSVAMIAFYIFSGAHLKKESFTKTVIFMQTLAFLSRDISMLGSHFIGVLSVLNGGSRIWMRTILYQSTGGAWTTFFIYITYITLFPLFLGIGLILFGGKDKIYQYVKTKKVLWKIISVHFIIGVISGILHTIYTQISVASSAELLLYISAIVCFVLSIAAGVWLKRETMSDVYLFMFNIMWFGLALTSTPLFNKIAALFIGGGIVFADLGHFSLPQSPFVQNLLLLCPLFVLLGSFIGRKLIKENNTGSNAENI